MVCWLKDVRKYAKTSRWTRSKYPEDVLQPHVNILLFAHCIQLFVPRKTPPVPICSRFEYLNGLPNDTVEVSTPDLLCAPSRCLFWDPALPLQVFIRSFTPVTYDVRRYLMGEELDPLRVGLIRYCVFWGMVDEVGTYSHEEPSLKFIHSVPVRGPGDYTRVIICCVVYSRCSGIQICFITYGLAIWLIELTDLNFYVGNHISTHWLC